MQYITGRAVPVICLDIKGYSIRSAIARGETKRRLKDIMIRASRFFLPYANIFENIPAPHDTGDGYYVPLNGYTEHVALNYVLKIRDILNKENPEVSSDTYIQLRIALVTANLDVIDGEQVSEEYINAARMVDWEGLRLLLDQKPELNIAIACSPVFHDRLIKDEYKKEFPNNDLEKWNSFSWSDKNSIQRECYLMGDEIPEIPIKIEDKEDETNGEEITRFRVSILISKNEFGEMPEALNFAKVAVLEFKNVQLAVDLSVDLATKPNLIRELNRGCDLLFYYGHGDQDGNLLFVDGIYKAEQLLELRQFENLKGVIVFACYGSFFTQLLPCSWIAFDESIRKEAPKSFLRAFVRNLNNHSLDKAIIEAKEKISELGNEIAECLKMGSRKWDEIMLSGGELNLLRYSPVMNNQFKSEYYEPLIAEPIDYPDHNPFVGRDSEFELLQEVPSMYMGVKEQTLYWIWGKPGMGKTAFLRQYYTMIRDYYFHENDEPIFVFQMNCWGSIDEQNLKAKLCSGLSKLYQLKGEETNLVNVIKKILPLGARHVWILDDLTDLDADKTKTVKAEKFISNIYEIACTETLPLILFASTRIRSNSGFPVHIDELKQTDAIMLAQQAWVNKYEQIPDYNVRQGALTLFEKSGHVTGIYKRSVFLALEIEKSYLEYAEELSMTGSLNNMDYFDFTQKLMKKEMKSLDKVSDKYNFRFGDFLAICFDLISITAHFTIQELINWFKDSFILKDEEISKAYSRGIAILCRIGFLTVTGIPQADSDSDTFTIPPNQREILRSIRKKQTNLPALPVREPQHRLALALEAANTNIPVALAMFNTLENDYKSDHSTIEKLEAYITALGVKFELLKAIGKPEEAKEKLDEMIALGKTRNEAGIVEQVAMAMVNLGIAYGNMKMQEKEVETYQKVISSYRVRTEAGIVEQVAMAMVNLGVTYRNMEMPKKEVETYQNMIISYRIRTEAGIVKQVAKAMVNLGAAYENLGMSEKTIETFQKVNSSYRDRTEASIVEQVAKAMFNLGVIYGRMEMPEKQVETYQNLISSYRDRTETGIVEQVAIVMAAEGMYHEAKGDRAQAIKSYKDLINFIKDRDVPSITKFFKAIEDHLKEIMP